MRAVAHFCGLAYLMEQQAFWTRCAAKQPFSFKELPAGYRPEFKVQREGVKSLSDIELLATVIGETKKESVLDVAGRVLALGERLHNTTLEELVPLVGAANKAIRLMAALELGRRLSANLGSDQTYVSTPESAAAILMPKMSCLDKEHFVVLALNTKNMLLAIETVAVGTLNSTSVQPREVFKRAIQHSAGAVILAHNHPSGDPTPSRQDIDLTKRMVEAGAIIGIKVIDHLIIGKGRWVSLKRSGCV